MAEGKGKGKGKGADPKVEKRALQQIEGSFLAFEKRVKTRLKLVEDLRLKCQLCEEGKAEPKDKKFDPQRALEDMRKQFLKEMMKEETTLNRDLLRAQKLLPPQEASPDFNKRLEKILKTTGTFKVGRTRLGLDNKGMLKDLLKGKPKLRLGVTLEFD